MAMSKKISERFKTIQKDFSEIEDLIVKFQQNYEDVEFEFFFNIDKSKPQKLMLGINLDTFEIVEKE